MSPPRDPVFDAQVLRIAANLEKLDYYRLLGLDHRATEADVKQAYYAVAARFHPDRNRDAAPDVQEAIYVIFKRLNEAYRVLLDAERRGEYDESLAAGKVRADVESRKSIGPKAAEDRIANRDARQFYVQASDALKKGNLLQAELHLKLALAREPKNKVIEALRLQIQAAKSQKN